MPIHVNEYPSQEELKKLFRYYQGKLYWRRDNTHYRKGKEISSTNTHGYVRVMIKKKTYAVHRIIWIIHKGEIPEGMEVDHKDRNRANNYLGNLRLLTHSQNIRNNRPGVVMHFINPDSI